MKKEYICTKQHCMEHATHALVLILVDKEGAKERVVSTRTQRCDAHLSGTKLMCALEILHMQNNDYETQRVNLDNIDDFKCRAMWVELSELEEYQ